MISIQGVSKNYGAVGAVKEISLEIPTAQTMALVGPSGCGKTTLLRLIAGLERPAAGKIFLNDKLLSSSHMVVPPYERNVAMIFQDLALWPHMTVEDHLLFSMGGKKQNRRDKKKKCREILSIVELEHLKRYPHELSGGEQQRLAIGRAIASEPKILLMDEPLSHLDTTRKDRLLKDIKQLIAQLKMTVVYVTHQIDEALYLSDTVTAMDKGRIKSVFTPDIENNNLHKLRN